MISNNMVKRSFDLCKNEDKQTGFIDYLIKKEKIVIIDLFFYLKEFIRRNFHALFIYLKVGGQDVSR
jgi:hypothetical protein